jgi:N6-adenosine-specific RNA methylase IME4
MSYDVILADPPWTFSVWNAAKSDRHTSHKYSLMTVDDICDLPVPSIMAENCALFLWATWPNIKDAFKVIEAWGFTYRTLGFDWVKAKKGGGGFHFGMGYYTRANSEPCLLAVRGRMAVESHAVRSLLYAPVRKHSQKPDEQYDRIETLYPNKRYLEMFARSSRNGWDVFGNEVENSITL